MAIPSKHDESRSVPEDLKQLLELVRERLPDGDLDKVRAAYFMAEEAHAGQTRSSGEPYVKHPLEVSKIVVGLHMDTETVVAALLHDVLEDTSATVEMIEERFGKEVLQLVEGVTKLRLNIDPSASKRKRAAAESDRAAESLRKMLLAMAQDVRVMVIKLADRLHNMRTLDALAPTRQTRIANETLDIYAPLAARLGIWPPSSANGTSNSTPRTNNVRRPWPDAFANWPTSHRARPSFGPSRPTSCANARSTRSTPA